ncbi:2611_t:CDS:2 [Scutellospora calospora]|uniref:2611_t:CDS:1 n=1 Tax=Scutellospora calospora TaxID=85575 RepID=A0ACA9L388_9GLOM|nr:2611_t:CDS:2 [Scutellospora calospora]
MSIFSLNQNIFEETHIENTQLQSDLSNLQFQFLVQDNDNLSLLETSEISENIEDNFLENEIWTEEELLKFKTLYYKTIDTFEKQDDDNQNLEENISLLQNENDFKKSFEKNCCEKISFQDIYLLDIIAATKRSEIVRNLKKSKLTTEYSFEGKSICSNAFKIIYGLGDTRWKNLRDHYVEHDINLRINSKTGKVGSRALSFETVMKVITFIADATYSSLYIQYLEAIKNSEQFEVSLITFTRVWKKFLPQIKKLTPRSDLCFKCKDMKINANY